MTTATSGAIELSLRSKSVWRVLRNWVHGLSSGPPVTGSPASASPLAAASATATATSVNADVPMELRFDRNGVRLVHFEDTSAHELTLDASIFAFYRCSLPESTRIHVSAKQWLDVSKLEPARKLILLSDGDKCAFIVQKPESEKKAGGLTWCVDTSVRPIPVLPPAASIKPQSPLLPLGHRYRYHCTVMMPAATWIHAVQTACTGAGSQDNVTLQVQHGCLRLTSVRCAKGNGCPTAAKNQKCRHSFEWWFGSARTLAHPFSSNAVETKRVTYASHHSTADLPMDTSTTAATHQTLVQQSRQKFGAKQHQQETEWKQADPIVSSTWQWRDWRVTHSFPTSSMLKMCSAALGPPGTAGTNMMEYVEILVPDGLAPLCVRFIYQNRDNMPTRWTRAQHWIFPTLRDSPQISNLCVPLTSNLHMDTTVPASSGPALCGLPSVTCHTPPIIPVTTAVPSPAPPLAPASCLPVPMATLSTAQAVVSEEKMIKKRRASTQPRESTRSKRQKRQQTSNNSTDSTSTKTQAPISAQPSISKQKRCSRNKDQDRKKREEEKRARKAAKPLSMTKQRLQEKERRQIQHDWLDDLLTLSWQDSSEIQEVEPDRTMLAPTTNKIKIHAANGADNHLQSEIEMLALTPPPPTTPDVMASLTMNKRQGSAAFAF